MVSTCKFDSSSCGMLFSLCTSVEVVEALSSGNGLSSCNGAVETCGWRAAYQCRSQNIEETGGQAKGIETNEQGESMTSMKNLNRTCQSVIRQGSGI